MTRVLTTAALLSLCCSPAWARDERDPWWGHDKALHLVVGVSVGAGCYGTLRLVSGDRAELRTALCATLGQIPGIGKELYDSGQPHNFFSGKDLMWTALGVLTSTLALFALEKLMDTPLNTPTPSMAEALGQHTVEPSSLQYSR